MGTRANLFQNRKHPFLGKSLFYCILKEGFSKKHPRHHVSRINFIIIPQNYSYKGYYFPHRPPSPKSGPLSICCSHRSQSALSGPSPLPCLVPSPQHIRLLSCNFCELASNSHRAPIPEFVCHFA